MCGICAYTMISTVVGIIAVRVVPQHIIYGHARNWHYCRVCGPCAAGTVAVLLCTCGSPAVHMITHVDGIILLCVCVCVATLPDTRLHMWLKALNVGTCYAVRV